MVTNEKSMEFKQNLEQKDMKYNSKFGQNMYLHMVVYDCI